MLISQSLSKPSTRFVAARRGHIPQAYPFEPQIQRQQGSLDSNGLRYLISMRSFFIYNANSLRPFTTPTATASLPRLKYRDVVWAFHSESQDLLLDASVKACPDRLTWENAKALGIFFWIKAPDVLVRPVLPPSRRPC